MHGRKSLLTYGLATLLPLFCSTRATSQSFAEIDFSSRPTYLPKDVVSLTFDDAPDWNNTEQILDILQQKKVKATFFLNDQNWSNLALEVPMQDLVRRMVAEGHTLGNHTSQHLHLGSLSADEVEQQIVSVEQTVKSILGASAARLTLLRAPFGEPYQDHEAGASADNYQLVAAAVARHGVHVGWNVDSFDYDCSNGFCVVNNVLGKLQQPGLGDYGIILMHSVHKQTVEGLPELIDAIQSRGFQIWSVEQVVKARFGKSSSELVSGPGSTLPGDSNPPGNPTKPKGCDAPAWVQGKWYTVGDVVVFENQVFTAQNENNPGYHPKISYWFWKAGPMCS